MKPLLFANMARRRLGSLPPGPPTPELQQAKVDFIEAVQPPRSAGAPSLAERIAELDERAGQIERRLGEIQRSLTAIESSIVDPIEAAHALAAFDPVWDALVPREQANLLQLLVERVHYDSKEVAITFRPAGLASLGVDTQWSVA
jgi:hypothetical protein